MAEPDEAAARLLDVEAMSRRWLERSPRWCSDIDGLVDDDGDPIMRVEALADFGRQVARACARVAMAEAKYQELEAYKAVGGDRTLHFNQCIGAASAAVAIRRALRRPRRGRT